jgi:UDP-N-acetylmuramate--alanine ligase
MDYKKVFFLGIGGIGMSAIARFMLTRGMKVYGYDKTPTSITESLFDEGAHIVFDDSVDHIPQGLDLVIYTPAIPKDSLMLNHFMNSGIEMIKRSQALGIITKDMYTIAVAGSHGKTTVSSMITYLLKQSGIDCSAFLGGISVNYQTNFILGKSEVVVVEADEYDRSFLQLNPDVIVITSVDTDHLDIYGTKDKIFEAFQEFVDKLKPGGTLIRNISVDESRISTKETVISYGVSSGDMKLKSLTVSPKNSSFTTTMTADQEFVLNYNGRHNVENALAAITVGLINDRSSESLSKALAGFRGIKRRFEMIAAHQGVVYIDDYAHHPTEIQALIGSVREIEPSKKIFCVFQPHLFTRTRDLANEFADALSMADEVVLLDIYPARELPIEGVSSNTIAQKMTNKVTICSKEEALEKIGLEVRDQAQVVILTVGAGNIDTMVSPIAEIVKLNESQKR